MTEMELLFTLMLHFESRVQQGLICGNFQNTQDVLALFAKYKGLVENRDILGSPRRDYDKREVSRRAQDCPQRDGRQRDHENNVNVRYIRRLTDRRSGSNQDGREFNP
jgi:hypothetical protein